MFCLAVWFLFKLKSWAATFGFGNFATWPFLGSDDGFSTPPEVIWRVYACTWGYPTIGFTLWLFNIAMENGPFIDGLPWFTYYYHGLPIKKWWFSMAMLNNQRVVLNITNVQPTCPDPTSHISLMWTNVWKRASGSTLILGWSSSRWSFILPSGKHTKSYWKWPIYSGFTY